jgi:adenylylsulfate kinase-like enzyme
VETCIRRDPKGLYAKALSGKESQVIGLDDPYDVPRKPDLVVDTESMSVNESVQAILARLTGEGWLGQVEKQPGG